MTTKIYPVTNDSLNTYLFSQTQQDHQMCAKNRPYYSIYHEMIYLAVFTALWNIWQLTERPKCCRAMGGSNLRNIHSGWILRQKSLTTGTNGRRPTVGIKRLVDCGVIFSGAVIVVFSIMEFSRLSAGYRCCVHHRHLSSEVICQTHFSL